MSEGIYFFGGILILVISGILAFQFYDAARDKGYDGMKYFWICFLFGIAGWILVAALPDQRLQSKLNEIAEQKGTRPAAPIVQPAAPANDSLPTL